MTHGSPARPLSLTRPRGGIFVEQTTPGMDNRLGSWLQVI